MDVLAAPYRRNASGVSEGYVGRELAALGLVHAGAAASGGPPYGGGVARGATADGPLVGPCKDEIGRCEFTSRHDPTRSCMASSLHCTDVELLCAPIFVMDGCGVTLAPGKRHSMTIQRLRV